MAARFDEWNGMSESERHAILRWELEQTTPAAGWAPGVDEAEPELGLGAITERPRGWILRPTILLAVVLLWLAPGTAAPQGGARGAMWILGASTPLR